MTALEDIYIYIVGDIYRYIVRDIYRYTVGIIYRYILGYIYRYMVGYIQIHGIAESCYHKQCLFMLTIANQPKLICIIEEFGKIDPLLTHN